MVLCCCLVRDRNCSIEAKSPCCGFMHSAPGMATWVMSQCIAQLFCTNNRDAVQLKTMCLHCVSSRGHLIQTKREDTWITGGVQKIYFICKTLSEMSYCGRN